MKKRYNNILFTSIVAILAFVSVTYVSCIKYEKNPLSCDYKACSNGGICYHGVCSCPAGYDSTFCTTMWIDKYPGKWSVSEVIKGSFHPWRIGQDSVYVVRIHKGGTLTSILIDSFLNNNYYYDVPVQLTSNTTIAFGTYFCPYNTAPAFSIQGGTGTIDATNLKITGTYYRTLQDSLGNPRDTVNFTMTKL